MIGNVDGSVNPLQVDQVAFDPIAESKVFDINVTGACSRLLGIAHGGTPIVIFVCNGCSFLRDVEVPKDAAYKQRHTANVACSHKFHFCGQEGNRRLESCLVGNGAAGKLDANAAERASSLDARCPVGVSIGYHNGCFMVRAVVRKEVLGIAINCREWAIGKIWLWLCAPEVDTVVACHVKVPDGMF